MNKIKNFFYDYGLFIGMVGFFILLAVMSGITGEMYGV